MSLVHLYHVPIQALQIILHGTVVPYGLIACNAGWLVTDGVIRDFVGGISKKKFVATQYSILLLISRLHSSSSNIDVKFFHALEVCRKIFSYTAESESTDYYYVIIIFDSRFGFKGLEVELHIPQ